MKKNIKKNVSSKTNNSYISMELPEVVDMNSLTYFDDENLDKYHSSLQNDREEALKNGVDTTPWEVEICYAQRELKIRSARRIAHEKYLKSNPDAFYENSVLELEDYSSFN